MSLRNGDTSECKQGIVTKLSAWRNGKREANTASDSEKKQWHFELMGDSIPLPYAKYSNYRGPFMRAGRKDEARPWLQIGKRVTDLERFHSDRKRELPFTMMNGKRAANNMKLFSGENNELPFAIMNGKRAANSKRFYSEENYELPFAISNKGTKEQQPAQQHDMQY